MLELKPLSAEAIPYALERAVRYRLLNDPWEAESICRDILRTDPENQEATYILVLCITDQFEGKYRTTLQQALEWIDKIEDPYRKDYCRGLIYERQATAVLKRAVPRAHFIAYEHLTRAMENYEKAEKALASKNEESILRWNACARMITRFKLEASPEEKGIQPFLDV